MIRTIEYVMDILRRSGPGALPATELKSEMRYAVPGAILSHTDLRRLVESASDRIQMLELNVDLPKGGTDSEPVESWLILTKIEDAPDRCAVSRRLWHSLAALAQEVDPKSRVEVVRWAMQAEEARRFCRLPMVLTPNRKLP